MSTRSARSIFGRAAMFLLLRVALWLAVSAPVLAGGVVGDGTAPSCTEAALNAALAGGGLVTFDCGPVPVTILLSGEKVIGLAQSTTIDGGGKITLSGGGATRLFSVSGAGSSLSLKNLALTSGNAAAGGAINNNGQLTIAGSTLFANNAPGGIGGAIYNAGIATITNSALSGNAAAAAGLGGGIDNVGILTIVNSTLSGNFGGSGGGAIINGNNLVIRNSTFDNNQSTNSGGAIANVSGPLTISGSTFFSNTSSFSDGGALFNNGGRFTVTTSVFYSNTSGFGGGGIYNDAKGAVAGSTLPGNKASIGGSGGGIYNSLFGESTIGTSALYNNSAAVGVGGGIFNEGTLLVTADTLAGNAAGAGGLGGAIYSDFAGSVTVINSTFSGNFGVAGGGIVAANAVTVTNSTFYGNQAGGLVNGGIGPVVVKNTILANNTSYDCSGAITSLGHNLDGANSCAFTAAGDLHNTDPHLGPLANNGGPTLTHALLLGSLAINAGTNAGCPATDQRGVPRPQSGDM